MSITIHLPWPHRSLSPNTRIDRRAKAGAIADARNAGYCAALDAMPVYGSRLPDGDLEMRLLFVPPDRRKHDQDNLLSSMKGYLDGVFRAYDADDSRVKRTVLEWGDCDGEGGRVYLVLESKEAA